MRVDCNDRYLVQPSAAPLPAFGRPPSFFLVAFWAIRGAAMLPPSLGDSMVIDRRGGGRFGLGFGDQNQVHLSIMPSIPPRGTSGPANARSVMSTVCSASGGYTRSRRQFRSCLFGAPRIAPNATRKKEDGRPKTGNGAAEG